MQQLVRPSSPLWLALKGPDAIGAGCYALFYCVLIALWPALPAQDAPAWIYEAELLHQVERGHSLSGCALVTALPPNAFAQMVLSSLMFAMSAELAGRVYMAGCVVALCASLVYLCRAREVRAQSWAVLSVLPLCVGYPWYHGFLNYMAALPVLGFGIGALLRNPDWRGARGLCLLWLLPVCLYTCHGTALGVWVVLLCVQCWVRRSWKLALRALSGLLPVLVLVGLYVLQRSAEGAAITWITGSVGATALYRLRSPLRFFSVFHGLAPTFDDPQLQAAAPVLVVLNVGYAIGLCVVGLRWALRAVRSEHWEQRFLALALLALTGCFIMLPHELAKMLNPAERLLLPAAMLGVAGAAGAPRVNPHKQHLVRTGLCALLVLQGIYALIWGTRAAQAAQALVGVRARYGFDVPVVQARQLSFAPPAPKLGAVGLLPRHQVLAMQGMLQARQAGYFVPPFDTGLFRCAQSAPSDQFDPSVWDLGRLRGRERPLILIGEGEQTRAVGALLANAFGPVAAAPGFVVLQRTAARGRSATDLNGP